MIENVKKSGLADKIIVEEYEGQKIKDIIDNKIDTFVIGSDWTGKFDYLKEYCDVVYLERTKGVSSTELRHNECGILKMGIIGSGRIASRFVKESKFVSGVNIEGVYNPHIDSAKNFSETQQLAFFTDELESFFGKINAVYIATPHNMKNAKKLISGFRKLQDRKSRWCFLESRQNKFTIWQKKKNLYYRKP